MIGTKIDILTAQELYENGMTLKEVGELCGATAPTIAYHFRRNNIKIRNKTECQIGKKRPFLSKENNPNWKGGRCTTCGYVKLNSNMREHRFIAEKVLGRKLNKSEVVHHIDGNGLNNANSNLVICTQSFHVFLHKLAKEKSNEQSTN